MDRSVLKFIVFLSCLALLTAGCGSGEGEAEKQGKVSEPHEAVEAEDAYAGFSANHDLDDPVLQKPATAPFRIDWHIGPYRMEIQQQRDNPRAALSMGVAFSGNRLVLGTHHWTGAYATATGQNLWINERYPTRREPLVDGESVYVNCGDKVAALSVKDGSVLWSRPLSPPGHTDMALASNILVLADVSGGMIGIDARTGDLSWKIPDATDSELATPVAATSDTVVIFPGAYDKRSWKCVIGVDVVAGKVRWRNEDIHKMYGRPIVQDGVVYTGGRPFGLDGRTGKNVWQAEKLKEIGVYDMTPAMDEAAVYTGNNKGMIYSYSRADGKMIHKGGLSWGFVRGITLIEPDKLGVTTDKNFVVMNRTDFAKVQVFEGLSSTRAAYLHGGRIFISSGSRLYCLVSES